ncbi:hypothetical protein jhhlp_001452 [Lomentospora prolificans]|uniref:RING-type domain-containing protein n=1 Tax=Lomentospora prolificans TaxID=41688 RepID=A0A2N3NIA0_9PEZI|nr:hypothetical protein jhhlp_001452 [Lomentospora prolificans]
MSSLVSDFIINPVLRQARRLSEISRAAPEQPATVDGDAATTPPRTAVSQEERHDHAVVDSPSTPRPTTSSTQSTSVESAHAADPSQWIYSEPPITPTRDHASEPQAPVLTPPKESLPEDDGMGALRRRLLEIQTMEAESGEKARLMHDALMEGYRNSQRQGADGEPILPTIPAGEAWEQSLALGPLDALKFWQHPLGEVSSSEKFVLTVDDVKPTYAVIDGQVSTSVLGCQHYRRNVKPQCSTCNKWYSCRFCHDAAEDHPLIRKDTKNMLCMLCACPQRASDVCINCGVTAARYYCNICKFWDDHPLKNIYHCHDCGICRRGIGLGKDFFHCKTCCACISISILGSHKCIERSTDCNCPICGEYMFTSPKPLVFMPCGHSIHRKCYAEHEKTSYKCPICNKAFRNMETQFRNLDVAIQSQPMPEEFQDTKAIVLCNDCCAKSTTKYHWLGLKCMVCTSYNTVELQILGGNPHQHPNAPEAQGRLEGAGQAQLQAQTILGQESNADFSAEQQAGAIAVRRRYSSHGQEMRYTIDPRLARSLSPGHGIDIPLAVANRTAEDDSEDDMLGFWSRDRGNRVVHSDDDEYDSHYDDSDSLPDLNEEDEDDEDSDDDIILIGHR